MLGVRDLRLTPYSRVERVDLGLAFFLRSSLSLTSSLFECPLFSLIPLQIDPVKYLYNSIIMFHYIMSIDKIESLNKYVYKNNRVKIK